MDSILTTINYFTLFVAVANLALGLLVLLRGKRSAMRISFIVVTFATAIWVFINYFTWNKLTAFGLRSQFASGAIIMPLFLIWLDYFIIGKPQRRYFLGLIVIGTVLFLIPYLPGAIVQSVAIQDTGFPVFIPGPLMQAYSSAFVILSGYIFYKIISYVHRSKDNKRTQLIYIFIGTLALIGTAITFGFILPLFGRYPIAPFDAQSSVIFVGFAAYAILRHRLFDISIVIRKTLVYSVVLALALGIFSAIALVLSTFVQASTRTGTFASGALTVVLIIAGYLPLKRFLDRRFGIVVLEDVYEKLLKEATVQATTQAQQTTKHLQEILTSRSQFFVDVAHELKTPLAILQGNIDLAVQKSNLEEAQTIQRELTRMTKLTRELIELGRIESGDVPLHRTTISLSGFLNDLAEEFRVLAEEKHIRLAVDVPADLVVFADHELLTKVATNLLSNALRYSGNDTVVTLHAQHDKNAVRLTVSDQGIGIAPEDLPRIWERFYRVNKQASRVAGGTGLGLPIVKLIVELHGGSVDVASEIRKGSTFTVRLPLPYNTEKRT